MDGESDENHARRRAMNADRGVESAALGPGTGLDRSVRPKGAEWARRHHRIVVVLITHTVVLAGVGLGRGYGVAHVGLELIPLVGFSGAAVWSAWSPRLRSIAASLGLMTAAAMAVHLADGRAEAHFLYFVLLGVLALYDDWLPYAVAVIFVLLQHGIMGALAPEEVYASLEMTDAPWMGAAIHGGFILAASAVAWVAMLMRNAERAASEKRRLTSEVRAAALVEHGSDLSSIFGLDGRLEYASPAHSRILGYDAASLVGDNVDALIHPDDLASVLERGAELAAAPGSTGVIEFRFAHADGSWRWVEATLANRLDDPLVRGFVCNAHDVTDRVHARDAFAYDAAHDPLTGLANRSTLSRILTQASSAAARHRKVLAVLYVDIDHFKQVNDTHGHATGDLVLAGVADRMSDCARADDTVLRIGGDEFVIVANVDDDAAATNLAGRICDAFDEPILLGDQPMSVSVSVGVATSADLPGDLCPVACADAALYAAKAAGRHGWALYRPVMTPVFSAPS